MVRYRRPLGEASAATCGAQAINNLGMNSVSLTIIPGKPGIQQTVLCLDSRTDSPSTNAVSEPSPLCFDMFRLREARGCVEPRAGRQNHSLSGDVSGSIGEGWCRVGKGSTVPDCRMPNCEIAPEY